MFTSGFMRELIEGFSKWLSELKADLGQMARNARKYFTALSAIRLVGLVLITGLTLTISSSFRITEGAEEVTTLMAVATGFDRVYYTEEEARFGEMAWALYASLALLAITFYLYKRGAGQTALVRHGFSGLTTICSLIVLGIVICYSRYYGDDNPRWWFQAKGIIFWYQTLMPLILGGLYTTMVVFLWRMTKPQSSPAPSQAADGGRETGLTVVHRQSAKADAGESGSGPQALSAAG